ncbi:hypothetical protein [Salinihabitans flavidus]|uniref:hypothetical protein n=1 Tax=Salinihabitans flavidus TaxID=569882 RepID=UPI00158746F2|nr:hypothetical protein [Salinihabitans flavidus]
MTAEQAIAEPHGCVVLAILEDELGIESVVSSLVEELFLDDMAWPAITVFAHI